MPTIKYPNSALELQLDEVLPAALADALIGIADEKVEAAQCLVADRIDRLQTGVRNRMGSGRFAEVVDEALAEVVTALNDLRLVESQMASMLARVEEYTGALSKARED